MFFLMYTNFRLVERVVGGCIEREGWKVIQIF